MYYGEIDSDLQAHKINNVFQLYLDNFKFLLNVSPDMAFEWQVYRF